MIMIRVWPDVRERSSLQRQALHRVTRAVVEKSLLTQI